MPITHPVNEKLTWQCGPWNCGGCDLNSEWDILSKGGYNLTVMPIPAPSPVHQGAGLCNSMTAEHLGFEISSGCCLGTVPSHQSLHGCHVHSEQAVALTTPVKNAATEAFSGLWAATVNGRCCLV